MKVRLATVLKNAEIIFTEKNIENPRDEAFYLLNAHIPCTRGDILLGKEKEVDPEKIDDYMKDVSKRVSGVPLQYLIGKWEFYGKSFYVGEGVLIPRPETELLIDIALDFLKGKKAPVCFDLCSGSGCIGITLASLISDSDVTVLEKSEKALSYLRRNKELNRTKNLKIIQGDLFNGACVFDNKMCDILLSNPPYIRRDILPDLQREVQAEPNMALDGGEDGLDFYRAIADKWVSCIKPDGMLVVEIGDEQGSAVCEIFRKHFTEVNVIKDLFGNDRVVTAKNINLE